MNRRKIKFNVWRDPTPKPIDYLSPHCTNGNCKWCSERRRRAAAVKTAALEASLQASMFDPWKRPIMHGMAWDALGYWPPDSFRVQYVKEEPRNEP